MKICHIFKSFVIYDSFSNFNLKIPKFYKLLLKISIEIDAIDDLKKLKNIQDIIQHVFCDN